MLEPDLDHGSLRHKKLPRTHKRGSLFPPPATIRL